MGSPHGKTKTKDNSNKEKMQRKRKYFRPLRRREDLRDFLVGTEQGQVRGGGGGGGGSSRGGGIEAVSAQRDIHPQNAKRGP